MYSLTIHAQVMGALLNGCSRTLGFLKVMAIGHPKILRRVNALGFLFFVLQIDVFGLIIWFI
ncbi:hypothetical protein D3C76_1697350 [compost metagenome]